MNIGSNGSHVLPKVPKVSRRTRVQLLASFTGGVVTTLMLSVARRAGHVAGDGKSADAQGSLTASLAGLTASSLVYLFIPAEKA